MMKKLLTLIMLSGLLFACGSDDDNGDPNEDKYFPMSDWTGDWNDPTDDAYKAEYNGKYNPIMNIWKVVKENGKAFDGYRAYYFGPDFMWQESIEKGKDGMNPPYKDKGVEYQINDKMFKTDKRLYKYEVKVVNNDFVMTYTDGATTWEMEPYKGEGWQWWGDWNDPSNRYYQIFNGKYNPIKGSWRLTHIDDETTITKAIRRYSDDLLFDKSNNDGLSYTPQLRYSINKIGLHEPNYPETNTYTEFEYTVNGDELILYSIGKARYKYTYTRIND